MATSTLPTQNFFPSMGGMNGMDNQVSDASKMTFANANNLLVGSFLPETQSHVPGKRGRKRKKDVLAKLGPSTSDLDSHMAPVACRFESSLGLLTKKFVDLMHQSEDRTVDLNIIATKLEVRKRRLYDITNVLEGIGLVEKNSKSIMHWRGVDSESDDLANQASQLQGELESLSSQEARLDESIREKEELIRALRKDDITQKHLIMSASDIMSLPRFKDQTVFAIKVPPQGSYIEVPDPDKDLCGLEKQCRMIVRNSTGPVDVFFLSKTGGKHNDLPVGDNTTKLASISGSSCVEAESERGASAEDQHTSSEQDRYETHKITPLDFNSNGPDEDYWLHSDIEFSLTDLWAC